MRYIVFCLARSLFFYFFYNDVCYFARSLFAYGRETGEVVEVYYVNVAAGGYYGIAAEDCEPKSFGSLKCCLFKIFCGKGVSLLCAVYFFEPELGFFNIGVGVTEEITLYTIELYNVACYVCTDNGIVATVVLCSALPFTTEYMPFV